MLHGVEILQIEQLAFKMAEEIFHHRVVIAVSLAAHTLSNAFLLQHPYILIVSVVPPLIGMKQSQILTLSQEIFQKIS